MKPSFATALLGAAALAGLAAAGAMTGPAAAQDQVPPAVKARQAHMSLYGWNMSLLGPMAQGKAEYNAEAAAAAAANLDALANLSQATYWPEGTSTDDLVETRALPALWAEGEVGEHIEELAAATATLAAEAGNGLEALQAAMGPVGKACGSCHEDYRMKDD